MCTRNLTISKIIRKFEINFLGEEKNQKNIQNCIPVYLHPEKMMHNYLEQILALIPFPFEV